VNKDVYNVTQKNLNSSETKQSSEKKHTTNYESLWYQQTDS